jgi:glycosyltransferase involved in cell wall biosynthesis
MTAPVLSVVIVAINPASLLGRCLQAFETQADPATELIVVFDASRGAGREGLRDRFPRVRWIEVPSGTTVPRRRAQGIRASSAPIVALIEDDCLVDDGWCRAIAEAHEHGPEAAIGGPIEPGPYRRSRDWAIYFCEYGRFMRPMPARARLSGTNVSYKRQAVLDAIGPEGLNDVFLHSAWSRQGTPMRADDRLAVRNVNEWPAGQLTVAPFHHGRAFAARRCLSLPVWRRGVLAGGTVFLPALQGARMIATVLGRRRHLVPFVKAIPAIALFTCSWSAGELAGCLFGDGGSASRWR